MRLVFYHNNEDKMNTREVISQELEQLPERDLDRLLAFLHSLKESRSETDLSTVAAENALAKDRLTPEEDAAWANL